MISFVTNTIHNKVTYKITKNDTDIETNNVNKIVTSNNTDYVT